MDIRTPKKVLYSKKIHENDVSNIKVARNGLNLISNAKSCSMKYWDTRYMKVARKVGEENALQEICKFNEHRAENFHCQLGFLNKDDYAFCGSDENLVRNFFIY